MSRFISLRSVATAVCCAFVLVACGDDGGGSAASFCEDAQGMQDRFDSLEVEGDIPDAAQFEEIQAALDDLEAPDEIADDMETVREGLRVFIEAFENFDPEDPSSFENIDLAELESIGAEFETAGDNIETYLEEECGIDTSGDEGSEDGTEEGE